MIWPKQVISFLLPKRQEQILLKLSFILILKFISWPIRCFWSDLVLRFIATVLLLKIYIKFYLGNKRSAKSILFEVAQGIVVSYSIIILMISPNCRYALSNVSCKYMVSSETQYPKQISTIPLTAIMHDK